MGLAKYYEDNYEATDRRMRDIGRQYYGNTYINSYPEYQRRTYASTTAKPVVRPAAVITKPIMPSALTKPKIGYILRNYEHSGIEIYFYSKPNEAIRNKLKANYWYWHNTKKCWYKKYSALNQSFAEEIIKN